MFFMKMLQLSRYFFWTPLGDFLEYNIFICWKSWHYRKVVEYNTFFIFWSVDTPEKIWSWQECFVCSRRWDSMSEQIQWNNDVKCSSRETSLTDWKCLSCRPRGSFFAGTWVSSFFAKINIFHESLSCRPRRSFFADSRVSSFFGKVNVFHENVTTK